LDDSSFLQHGACIKLWLRAEFRNPPRLSILTHVAKSGFDAQKDVTKKWPQRAQTDQVNRRNTPKYPNDKLRFRLLAIPKRLC
jgi:hypothetical protein